MKTYHASFKAGFRAMAFGFLGILAASCSTSQSTAKSPDGIYGERYDIATNQSSGNGYQQYFASLREDEILTDADQYSSYDAEPGSAENQGYSEWGGSPSQVIVNVYDNNWGMAYWNNYWYSPYYSWGWSHWHGYYGWNVGLGWNSWYGPGWGWGYNHWYGNPYYGHYPYYGGSHHHHYYNYGRDRGRHYSSNSGRNAVSRMQTPSRGRVESTAPVRGRNNVAPTPTGRNQTPVFTNSRNNTQQTVRPRTNTTPNRNNNYTPSRSTQSSPGYTPSRSTQPSRSSGTTVSPSRSSGGGGGVRTGGGGGGRSGGGGGGRR